MLRRGYPLIILRLPLYEEHSCALGVVIMSYLDELNGKEDPMNPYTREKQQTTAQGWIPNCDFKGSLGDTLQLWDAVSSIMLILAFDDNTYKNRSTAL